MSEIYAHEISFLEEKNSIFSKKSLRILIFCNFIVFLHNKWRND